MKFYYKVATGDPEIDSVPPPEGWTLFDPDNPPQITYRTEIYAKPFILLCGAVNPENLDQHAVVGMMISRMLNGGERIDEYITH